MQRGIVANRVACLSLLRATVLESHRVWTSWQEWDQTPSEGEKESQGERKTMSVAQ